MYTYTLPLSLTAPVGIVCVSGSWLREILFTHAAAHSLFEAAVLRAALPTRPCVHSYSNQTPIAHHPLADSLCTVQATWTSGHCTAAAMSSKGRSGSPTTGCRPCHTRTCRVMRQPPTTSRARRNATPNSRVGGRGIFFVLVLNMPRVSAYTYMT